MVALLGGLALARWIPDTRLAILALVSTTTFVASIWNARHVDERRVARAALLGAGAATGLQGALASLGLCLSGAVPIDAALSLGLLSLGVALVALLKAFTP